MPGDSHKKYGLKTKRGVEESQPLDGWLDRQAQGRLWADTEVTLGRVDQLRNRFLSPISLSSPSTAPWLGIPSTVLRV